MTTLVQEVLLEPQAQGTKEEKIGESHQQALRYGPQEAFCKGDA